MTTITALRDKARATVTTEQDADARADFIETHIDTLAGSGHDVRYGDFIAALTDAGVPVTGTDLDGYAGGSLTVYMPGAEILVGDPHVSYAMGDTDYANKWNASIIPAGGDHGDAYADDENHIIIDHDATAVARVATHLAATYHQYVA